MRPFRSTARLLLLVAIAVAGASTARAAAAAVKANPGSLAVAGQSVQVAVPVPVVSAIDFSTGFNLTRDGGSASLDGPRPGQPRRPRPTAGTTLESRIRAVEQLRRVHAADIRMAASGLPTFHAGPPPPLS